MEKEIRERLYYTERTECLSEWISHQRKKYAYFTIHDYKVSIPVGVPWNNVANETQIDVTWDNKCRDVKKKSGINYSFSRP